ncbi:membrane protein [Methyloferula stellata]|uniref:membrane protein n=1 Tax=Methyloferula stellata TaxID=876270 RepID=UPI00035DC51D|nr:membrane protein [Methyloferula stellata]
MNDFNLSFTPLLPLPLFAVLGICALIVVGLGFYARRRGTFLRAVGFALLLLALADPAIVREDREPLKDVVAIVVDRSGSQTIGERPQQTEKAKAALEKSLDALGHVDVRVIESGRTDADSDGTQLFSALNTGLADVPAERVGGVFMITDGVVHDIPKDVEALGIKAPLHALITGHEGERDRRIELLDAPRFGIVGKDQTIELRVDDTGSKGEPVVLHVRRDGNPIANVTAHPGERIRIPVRIEHGGQNVVEIEVDALPDELTAINNKAVLSIDGVRDKLKVLLVSGEPHQGERMWRNLLKSDANVELVHFTILRPPEKQDGTPINELSLIAFPTADLFGRKITDFDLIIFDRYSNQSVLPTIYLDNIVRYVRDGGALLFAAGPDFARPEGLFYSPLGRIAPARPDGSLTEHAFRAVVTSDGAKHPVTRGLAGADQNPPAWSQWFRQVNADVARGTSVLSGADGKPLLVLSREGKGRVALLLTDQMWLWARGFEGGGPHLDLSRRLAHWLMKEPDLEEEALRATVEGHDLVIERQSLKDQVPPVKVTAPSGKQETVTLSPAEPGLSRARVKTDEIGLYRLTDGQLSVLANVGPENPREFQEVVSTPDKLKPLAEATGGTVRRIATDATGDIALPRLVAMRESPVYGGPDYAAIKRTGTSEVKGVGVAPLAIGFLGLLFLLASLLGTWAVEGRRNAGLRKG